ncbi:hypothetical protein [Aliidiomarina sanyensis]|uniref:Uncharacterized protein n=1 Tax=Aliidiomarina sanyensis TaxID=1249555 RepID=A0A432WPS2_9GAMM|nr:hypothetical protein [Aliidiomarina sanyensis]RUO35792.1 hypothetical protein CWE11_03285 [Aliidiomarina sanyensis]
MSKFLHWMYIAIICILAIILWQARSHIADVETNLQAAEQEITALRAIPEPEPLDFDQRRVLNLEALVNELQAENRALTRILTQREADALEDALEEAEFYAEEEDWESLPEDDAAADRGPVSNLNDPQVREALENAQARMLNLDDFELRLENEPVDPEWAFPAEQQLRDMFVNVEGLRHYQVEEIECRTYMCRLRVTSLDQRPFDARLFTTELRNVEGLQDLTSTMILERAEEDDFQIFVDRSLQRP